MAAHPTHDNELLRLLAAAGHTQSSLARALGVSRQQINKWFVDGRRIPPEWATRIAPLLKVSPVQLVFRDAIKQPEPSGFADVAVHLDGHAGPPPEYDRLPEQVQALADALGGFGITLPPRALTRHAQFALDEASRMDRRLPFEERARIAAEAKAADINRALG